MVETWVRVTTAGLTGLPSSVTLTSTFGTAVPPVLPLTGVPVSLFATIAAASTVTVTVASSQFVGLSTSHRR
ncbi:hypothetical protein D3C71_2136560 [compost metagenome]